MKVNIKLKPTSIEKLVKQLTVCIDSREQENQHIINYLEKKKINYEVKKLEFGDYSCKLLKNEELGLPFDISLESIVSIERKGSGGNGLTEIAHNFTEGRTAFENEFIRAKENCENFYVIIENGSWEDIKAHNYRSELNENALYNSLISWRKKYNFHIDFIKSENVGEHILKVFATILKKMLEE